MSSLRTHTNHRRLLRFPIIQTVIITALFSLRARAGSGCYFINGTENPHATQYSPCNPNAKASMCCAIGKGRLNKDQCLDSGLCLGDPFAARIYWRESCTDPTWTSPECVKLCTGPEWDDQGDIWLTVCQNGKFCCGRPGTIVAQNCCKNGQGFIYNTTMPNAEQFALAAGSGAASDEEPDTITITIQPAETTATDDGEGPISSSDETTSTISKPEASASSTTTTSTTLAALAETPLPTTVTPVPATTVKRSPLEGGVIAGIAIAGLVAAALIAWTALLIARHQKTELLESSRSRGFDSTTPVYVSHENLRSREHGHGARRYHHRVDFNQPLHELPDRRYTVQELEGDPAGYEEKGPTRASSQEGLTGAAGAESAVKEDTLPRKI